MFILWITTLTLSRCIIACLNCSLVKADTFGVAAVAWATEWSCSRGTGSEDWLIVRLVCLLKLNPAAIIFASIHKTQTVNQNLLTEHRRVLDDVTMTKKFHQTTMKCNKGHLRNAYPSSHAGLSSNESITFITDSHTLPLHITKLLLLLTIFWSCLRFDRHLHISYGWWCRN